jgi:predicted double-glycine peptidase
MSFNRDLMNHASIKESAASTMRVIDAAQDLPPHLQLIGITATFKLMIERFGVSPADAFTVADNIMNHAQGRREEFNAVRAYLENEV